MCATRCARCANSGGERMRFIVLVEADIKVPDEPGVEPTDLDNVVRSHIAPHSCRGVDAVAPPLPSRLSPSYQLSWVA